MRFSTVVLAGFVVLTSALAFKTIQLGQELPVVLRDATLKANEADAIKRGLLDRIQVLRPPPYSLAGTEATAGGDVTYSAVNAMVLYVFGPSCPFSPENVPFLNELHAAGISVIGVAPGEPQSVVNMFVRTSEPIFPVLAHPRGGAVEILPLGPVPLTAVFLEGRLQALWLGLLEEGRQQLLEEWFGLEWEGG